MKTFLVGLLVLVSASAFAANCPETEKRQVLLKVGEKFSVNDYKYASNGPIEVSVYCKSKRQSYFSDERSLIYTIIPGEGKYLSTQPYANMCVNFTVECIGEPESSEITTTADSQCTATVKSKDSSDALLDFSIGTLGEAASIPDGAVIELISAGVFKEQNQNWIFVKVLSDVSDVSLYGTSINRQLKGKTGWIKIENTTMPKKCVNL